MVRVDAVAYITLVQHIEARRDMTMRQFPSNPMSTGSVAVVGQVPIFASVERALPQPAIIVAADSDSCPERYVIRVNTCLLSAGVGAESTSSVLVGNCKGLAATFALDSFWALSFVSIVALLRAVFRAGTPNVRGMRVECLAAVLAGAFDLSRLGTHRSLSFGVTPAAVTAARRLSIFRTNTPNSTTFPRISTFRTIANAT